MFNPQKTQLNQLYMPLTVKVQYKDKLFKLAQATLTLQQVHNEMKQRFPNIVSFHYYYKDEQVNDLSAIMTQASREGNTSVKLIAKKASLEISLLNESSVVFEQEKNESSNISLLAQSEIKMEQKPKVSLPNEFYVCFNCQGAKFIKSNSTVELCSICKGVGRLEQAHKYISRLRELYLKHFKPIAQAETILEKFRQEEIPQRKGSFARVDKNYDIIVRQTTKKETMQVGKIFSMRFQIKNIGPSWQKRSIEVIEMGQNQGKTLSALKNGEVMEIQLGPFICNNEGLFEKTYTLCFRQGENLVRFGHKFGFSVKGFKAKPVRKIVSNQRERIRDLKMISGSSKSEQYLSLKLKSMGIDIMNLQIDEELIIEMIKQFK